MLVPAAIIFAGLVAAISIYNLRHTTSSLQIGNPGAVSPVNPTTDHILGNPTAPIVLIEYADISSQYSKDFQQVMDEVATNYAGAGNVAWVYRHFPVGETDPNAGEHSEAAECVAALGGNTAFFKFIDAVQTAAPNDSPFAPAGYDDIVSALGLSSGTFDSCLTAHTYQSKVAADFANAQLIGATGAPYSVLLVKGQPPTVISGSVPYDTMKQVLDKAIAKVLKQ